MNNNNIFTKEDKLTTAKVARILKKSDEFIRVCLQKGLFPFGYAVKLPGRKKYNYYINTEEFNKYIGNNVQNKEKYLFP